MAKNKTPKPEATTPTVVSDHPDKDAQGVAQAVVDAAASNPLLVLEGAQRVAGVVVEDVAEGKHRVHVLERDEHGALVLWPVERGEVMPWHATRSVVEKVVETRLTPEDKR